MRCDASKQKRTAKEYSRRVVLRGQSIKYLWMSADLPDSAARSPPRPNVTSLSFHLQHSLEGLIPHQVPTHWSTAALSRRDQRTGRFTAKMKSLRRDLSSNPQAANVTSKIFVRSTKSGKVQKIVRELYLRQDIPCSSKLCSICPSIAPADANGNSKEGAVFLRF